MDNNKDILEMKTAYQKLFNKQQFDAAEVDYVSFEEQKAALNVLAEIGHSGISVFDFFRQEHIVYSPNFCVLLDYDVVKIQQEALDIMESKNHHEDYGVVMKK